MLKRGTGTRRNDRCICGSGKKFKYCCSHDAVQQPAVPQQRVYYIDTGEEAVRYVITDEKGTSFFSTKDNQIIVFKKRADAIAVATLDEFSSADSGEINVAGVGDTKWARLQEKLPFVEVENAEAAIALVHDRMEHLKTLIEAEAQKVLAEEPKDEPKPAEPENG